MEPFLGMIGLFGFNYAPQYWAVCDGSLLPIAQNTALFSLLGTQYGGNGQTTFALPDLRGRTPIGQGQGPGLNPYTMGEMAGTETVTLIQSQMPAHNHMLNVSGSPADADSPSGNVLAVSALADGASVNTYGQTINATANPQSIGVSGGTQPHPNMQPYLVMNYCIALQGIYPPRN